MIREIVKDETFLCVPSVAATTADLQMRIKTYKGWTAQIIQHEIDHLNGGCHLSAKSRLHLGQGHSVKRHILSF